MKNLGTFAHSERYCAQGCSNKLCETRKLLKLSPGDNESSLKELPNKGKFSYSTNSGKSKDAKNVLVYFTM